MSETGPVFFLALKWKADESLLQHTVQMTRSVRLHACLVRKSLGLLALCILGTEMLKGWRMVTKQR